MEKQRYTYDYPRPAVTTDCVIFGFDGTALNVLLVERGVEPFKGRWALPGGFLRMDESARNGALRELEEETGLTGAYMEQLHTYSEPNRDPRGRVVTIAYFALVRQREVRGGDDAAQARWFPLDNVPSLAFDHDHILADARRSLRERMHFKPVGFNLLPEQFTARELQTLYETILGVRFDRRNFLKKMQHLNIITPVAECVSDDMVGSCDSDGAADDAACDIEPSRPGRTASRFRFNDEKYHEMKRDGFKIEF